MAYVPQTFFILLSCIVLVLSIRFHGEVSKVEDRSTPLANAIAAVCFLALFYWGGFFDDLGDGPKHAFPQVFVLLASVSDCISRLVVGKRQGPFNGILSTTRVIILNYALYCGGVYDIFLK